MTCKCSRNSIEALEAIPGWWTGAATVRRQFQAEAEALGHKAEADAHARMASLYEKRAETPPRPASAVLINLRAAGAL
jgi:hypothetical protein